MLTLGGILYGALTIVGFVAPFIVYFAIMKNARNRGGRLPSVGVIVIEGVGWHLLIIIAITIAFVIADTFFGGKLPVLDPQKGLEEFFMLSTAGNSFIEKWMNATFSTPPTELPIAVLGHKYYGVVLKVVGMALTIFYIIIPIYIIKFALFDTVHDAMQDMTETTLLVVGKSVGTFVFATLMVWLHLFLASVPVMVVTGSEISFFGEMQQIWNKILFTGA